jgi:hypothetical protein
VTTWYQTPTNTLADLLRCIASIEEIEDQRAAQEGAVAYKVQQLELPRFDGTGNPFCG